VIKRIFLAFAKGMAYLGEGIGIVFSSGLYPFYSNRYAHWFGSDEECISRDWRMFGDDIRKAMNKFDQVNNKKADE